MKKAGSSVVSFPKSRRSEQTGYIHKGLPLRWLGLLALTTITTIGGAWAIGPNSSVEEDIASPVEQTIENFVFEGEPEVVAQMIGSVLGPERAPHRSLRSMGTVASSGRRVVVAQGENTVTAKTQDLTAFFETVESVESEFSIAGEYPSIPATHEDLEVTAYKSNGRSFQIESGAYTYSSDSGFSFSGEDDRDDSLNIAGFLETKSSGWGPWKKNRQAFDPSGQSGVSDLAWLANVEETPTWSARMYFPVSEAFTGQVFRRADGSSAYRSGEVLYDGVSGAFQMKLYRDDTVPARKLSPSLLENSLEDQGNGCVLAGDAALLTDLGVASGTGDEGRVLRLTSPSKLSFLSESSLAGLTFSALGNHETTLQGGQYLSEGDSTSKSSAVGRLAVVDRLGQVHQLRIRAGRGAGYDWIVGQMCDLEEQAQESEVFETEAFKNAYAGKAKRTIVAGE